MPEPVKSASPPEWVYRSDEPKRVPPSQSSASPIERPIATSALDDDYGRPRAGAVRLSRTSFELFNPVPWVLVGFRMTAWSVMTPFLVGTRLMSGLSRR